MLCWASPRVSHTKIGHFLGGFFLCLGVHLQCHLFLTPVLLFVFFGFLQLSAYSVSVVSYEGWYPYEINFIVRLSYFAGVKLMILTNSAGGSLKGMGLGLLYLCLDAANHVNTTNFSV